jgi:hypothetical protein
MTWLGLFRIPRPWRHVLRMVGHLPAAGLARKGRVGVGFTQ